tara:strand:+ start:1022 stop:1285 length:264 start_codon:yes stop_codon:yes gene_type:complete
MNKPTPSSVQADQYFAEVTSATHLRREISFLIGYVTADNPAIAARLKDILKEHAVKTKRPFVDHKCVSREVDGIAEALNEQCKKIGI